MNGQAPTFYITPISLFADHDMLNGVVVVISVITFHKLVIYCRLWIKLKLRSFSKSSGDHLRHRRSGLIDGNNNNNNIDVSLFI